MVKPIKKTNLLNYKKLRHQIAECNTKNKTILKVNKIEHKSQFNTKGK